MLALPVRRLVRESAPVAAILLFWSVLSWFAPSPEIGASVRDAGVVMAALFVVRRGVALSSEVVPVESNDFGTVLYENARVAAPAGVWFLAAAAVVVSGQYWDRPGLLGVFLSPALVRACVGAGIGVVGLYAVAVGYSVLRGVESSDAAPADDRL